MNVNEAAEQAWDGFVGSGTTSEMMAGFNTPEEAVNAYCEDWPFTESDPDDEQDDLMGYTPRQLLVIYLDNNENEWKS